jgi:hypothetical protein
MEARVTSLEDFERDLDDLRRDQLHELGMPGDVADVLDGWLATQHGALSSHHGVGSFLDGLAAVGYRVTKIERGPSFEELLPAPTE